MSQPVPILIAGPTAVGKTEIALEVALQLGGEIVSVDSMQVYRGMDIGTAKPSLEDRRGVPHHLLDIIEISDPFDAARFAQLANTAIEDIRSRNRTPILTGGTGLYFKAVLDGIGHAPGADPDLREQLERAPLPELLAELQRRDPALYEQIDRNNPRRIIRAIEVIRKTGRPFSEQRAAWQPRDPGCPAFVLSRSQEDLRCRIDARVVEMFRRGLVEETRSLIERGLSKNRTAMQALGYRQVVEYLEGKRLLPETIELVKVRTRQYAKRQLTWFRRHLQARWIDLPPATSKAAVSRMIIGAVK
jgi:tRNA dimethylallyltransferase